ncbi:hypothetical protein TWF718_001188 [Orbilia javanica]|uniref:Uncharacterized protein n=1 Tax=Orbilia javanica TaxID=47235 RepID=A0AAN8RN53_9PEZI
METEQEFNIEGTDELPADPPTSHSEVDSGYFSRDRITKPTTEPPPQDRVIITHDPVSRTSKSFSAKGFFVKSKQPELLLFSNAHVPDEFYSRFQDLVQLYDRPLKSKLKPKFMAWKVKVLGENESSKRPYIVILCDPASTKKLTKFFSKKEIKQQCEGTEGLPPLPVLVIASTPTRVAVDILEVFGREDVFLDTSLGCGESIKIVNGGKAKMATLGGIVKVTIGGEVQFYGITAGHIVEEDTDDEGVSIGDLSEASGSEAGPDDESSSETSSISTNTSSPDIHVPTEDGGCNFGWKKIGHVAKPTTAMQGLEDCNLDWSLVDIIDGERKKMNFIKNPLSQNGQDSRAHQASDAIDTIYLRKYGNRIDAPVLYQPGTEPGYLKGTINTMPAFMHQSPSNKMARVYNMSWDSEWDKVSAGDCGSWVVDPGVGTFGLGSHAVYGHIVAVDIFDEAYVVPFEDTMEQLKGYLGAEVVELPSCEDLSLGLGSARDLKSILSDPLAPRRSLQFVAEDGSPTQRSTSTPAKVSNISGTTPARPEVTIPEALESSGASIPDVPSTLAPSSSGRDYISELSEYCRKFNLAPPIYRHNEVAISITPELCSETSVYIEGMLYGASLWKEMHPSRIDADQLASREALRNLAIHHQALLFEVPEDTGCKPEKPRSVVGEATMNQYRKKQLKILLPKLTANTREGEQSVGNQENPADTEVTKSLGKYRRRISESDIVEEQDIPAAVRLKKWFVAARKRHPAETIDALLNKQCDLEDRMSDAKYAQESIRREIQRVEGDLARVSAERDLIRMQRETLEGDVELLKLKLLFQEVSGVSRHRRNMEQLPYPPSGQFPDLVDAAFSKEANAPLDIREGLMKRKSGLFMNINRQADTSPGDGMPHRSQHSRHFKGGNNPLFGTSQAVHASNPDAWQGPPRLGPEDLALKRFFDKFLK